MGEPGDDFKPGDRVWARISETTPPHPGTVVHADGRYVDIRLDGNTSVDYMLTYARVTHMTEDGPETPRTPTIPAPPPAVPDWQVMRDVLATPGDCACGIPRKQCRWHR